MKDAAQRHARERPRREAVDRVGRERGDHQQAHAEHADAPGDGQAPPIADRAEEPQRRTERGYDDTSVEDVAARAGIAKRTIYNIYRDKESLFRATVSLAIDVAERFIRENLVDVGALPETELVDVAVGLARAVLLGRVVPLRRLVAGEASRFPELAADYRDRAPKAVMRSLAAGFTALATRSELAIDDPVLAAEHFAFLALGAEVDRRMFGDDRTPPDEVDAHAAAGARAFLRAYRSIPSGAS